MRGPLDTRYPLAKPTTRRSQRQAMTTMAVCTRLSGLACGHEKASDLSVLGIDAAIERNAFDILKSDGFQKFSCRFLIIGEPVLIVLTEVVIDVFKTSFAVAGMPRRVRFARLKIIGGRTLSIVPERPLGIRHTET